MYSTILMIKKYNCDLCGYETDKLGNYNRHMKTKKHISHTMTRINQPNNGIDQPNNGVKLIQKGASNIMCEFCKKIISHKNHIRRHQQTCTKYIEHQIKYEKNTIISELKNKLEENEEELKKKQEELDELKDIEKEFLEFMKKVSNTGGNVINNIKQVNMFYIVQTYIEAKNCEDLMEPPLTADEKQYVHENGGVYGGYHILVNRCVNGLELNERPFHCVDGSRNKYMIRTNDTWQIDRKGKQVLEHIYPKMLKICAPKKIASLDELDKWSKYNKYMIELSNNGEGKILKMLNKVTLLKNNVAIE